MDSEKKKYTISIIEDSKIHKEWLLVELSTLDNINVVSVESLGRDGIKRVKHYNPDMVLIDFQLEDMTGLEVSRRIKAYNNNVKVFALTAHTEISIIERILNDKNIDALAVKGSRYFELNFLLAVTSVLEGGTYLDPSLLINLRAFGSSSGLNQLTKREFEIFVQYSSGKAEIKIATDLCVELAHVRNLKSRISKKLKNYNIDNLITKLEWNSHPDMDR